jgi:2-polyprenyl-3-methyl-5-hydroxy-6-metoxy-1,4-benzoquinol methylase
MNESPRCLFCVKNHYDYKIFHEKLRYDHPGKIYKCEFCDFVFLHPKLSEIEQEKYYSEEYRSQYETVSVEKRFQDDMIEANRRLFDLKKLVSSDKKLLEIGSGSGAFLSLSTNYFDSVSGVELDINAKDFLKKKGLNIFSNLEDIEGQKFDVIVMFHVLEHLLDPVFFIKNISKYLNENGKLIIEVPNIDDALLKFYDIDEFKNFYFCSAHLSYFSKKTLEDCLVKAGFAGEIFLIQRYDLTNHLHWLRYRGPGGFLKEKEIFDQKTLRAYESDLREKGLSDTLWGVFQINEFNIE